MPWSVVHPFTVPRRGAGFSARARPFYPRTRMLLPKNNLWLEDQARGLAGSLSLSAPRNGVATPARRSVSWSLVVVEDVSQDRASIGVPLAIVRDVSGPQLAATLVGIAESRVRRGLEGAGGGT